MSVYAADRAAPERLVITGFMGTGKTHAGTIIAHRLGLPFLDLDRLIETTHGEPVAAIFSVSGEAGFRAIERDAVRWAAGLRRVVMATGGGTFLDPANRRDLAARSLVVTLTAAPEFIAARLAGSASAGGRPLLAGGDVRSRISALLAARQTVYAASDLTLDTGGLSVDEVAGRVVDWALKAGLKSCPQATATDSRAAAPFTIRAPTYDVVVGGDLGDLPDFISGLARQAVFTIADAHTAALFGDRVAVDAVVPAGEATKCFGQVEALHAAMARAGLGRDGLVVALGGGVVGDLAGFAAATFMRGIPVVQVPTTLLAQVDSAIGGKTAVNVGGLKNLAGAFHEPAGVFAAVRPLLCLPDAEFRQGLVEAVKTGLACDPRLLDLLESEAGALLQREPGPLARLTAACARAKVGVVAGDPRETGDRRRLNLGHTVGHAVEATGIATEGPSRGGPSHGDPSHGDAVAFGLIAAMTLAVRAGLAPRAGLERLLRLYRDLGLTLVPGREAFARLDRTEFIRRLAADKKNRGGELRMVLPREPGVVDLGCPVSPDEILRACEETSRSEVG
ncbi:MAG: bifunctional shikimate kinase/3-dehydroquinate synthase [Bacillota bacterium]